MNGTKLTGVNHKFSIVKFTADPGQPVSVRYPSSLAVDQVKRKVFDHSTGKKLCPFCRVLDLGPAGIFT
jgi:hypothetical protein